MNEAPTVEEVIEAAKKYRDSFGMRIIPVAYKNENKRPLIKEWQKRGTASDEDLERWRHDFGIYNIGCLCGEIAGLDLDKPERYEEFKESYPSIEQQTMVIKTFRGYRPLFRTDRAMQGRKFNEINVEILGIGNQSILPPSFHYKGIKYTNIGTDSILFVPHEELEEVLNGFIIRCGGKISHAVDVSTILKGVQEGMRNEAGIRIAAYLRIRNIGEKGALEVVREWNNKKNKPPLPDAEIVSIVKSAYQREPPYRYNYVRRKREERGEAGNYFDKSGRFIPKRLADELMKDFIFKTLEDTEEIYVYDGGIYRAGGEVLIKGEAQQRLGEKAQEHAINEVVGVVQRSTYTPRRAFDVAPHLINLRNGIFNLRSGKLLPHTPDALFMTQMPIKYDKNATCPAIGRFLQQVMSPDDVPAVEESIGHCTYRDYPIQKSLMLVGGGANGKTTLLQLIEAFLGKDNVSHIALQEIDTNRFSIGNLYGKLANIFADLSNEALQGTGRFKMLTGGDTITAEKKFKAFFSFRNFAKMIFSTNQIPYTKDETDAFFRRWLIINFPNIFEGDAADKNLIAKLTTEEELSGLFNKAIEGLNRLLTQGGFSNQGSTQSVRERYTRMSDSVQAFVWDCIVVSPDAYIEKQELLTVYREYSRTANIPTVSEKIFFQRFCEKVRVEDFRPTLKHGKGSAPRAFRGVAFLEGIKKRYGVHQIHYIHHFSNSNTHEPLSKNVIVEEGRGVKIEKMVDIVDVVDMETTPPNISQNTREDVESNNQEERILTYIRCYNGIKDVEVAQACHRGHSESIEDNYNIIQKFITEKTITKDGEGRLFINESKAGGA